MQLPSKLSEHFSIFEATSSDKAKEVGINNVQGITADILHSMVNTATQMEKVRTILGCPIHVDSFYRCLELNTAIGGSKTSQHMKGEAVDFIAPEFGDPLKIAKVLAEHKEELQFDQLIMEHTWVHISFCSPTVQPRGEVLSLIEGGHYAEGFTDMQGNPV